MKILNYLILGITLMLLTFSTVVYAETNTIDCYGVLYTYDESGKVTIDGYWIDKGGYDEFLSQVGEAYAVTAIELTKEVHGIDAEAFVNSQSTLREITISLNINFIGYNIFGENHNAQVKYAGSEERWNNLYKENEGEYFGDVTFFAKGAAALNGMSAEGYADHISGNLFFEFVNQECVAEFAIYSYNENEELELSNTYTLQIPANKNEIDYEFDFVSDGKEHVLRVTLYENITNRTQWGEVYERSFTAYDNSCVCERTSILSENSQLKLFMDFLYVENDCVAFVEVFDYDEEDNLTFNKDFTIEIPAGKKQVEYDIPFRFDNKRHLVKYSFYDNTTNKNELFDSMTDEFTAYQQFNGFTYEYIDEESVQITECYSYFGTEEIAVPVKISGYEVVAIGEDAFADCFAESIIIPNTITKIGNGAFNDCTNLTKVKYIGDKASWDSIVIEENNEALTTASIIYDYVPCVNAYFANQYDGKDLNVSVWITDCYVDCLVEIELFNLSKSETTVVNFEIPAGTYGEKKVTIPLSNYDETFKLYGSVVSVDKTINYSVPYEFAFFTPYADVEELQEDDFQFFVNDANEAVVTRYLGNGTELVIPDTLRGYPVTTLQGWCFSGLDITDLTIGKNLKNIGYGALSYCFNLKNIIVAAENEYYKFENGVLYNADKTELVLYLLSNTAEHFTIPESVTVVGAHAFEATENLKTVTVSKNVKRLERQAFAYSSISGELILPEGLEMIGSEALVCNFSKIHIPKSVTQIAKDAMAGSMGLTEITVDIDNANYTSADGALYNKDKTVLMKYPEARTESALKIPRTVVRINEAAFIGVENLVEINIPKSIKLINDYAFWNCVNLEDVYYAGTEEEWGVLLISMYNDITNANIHFAAHTKTTVSDDEKNFTVTPVNIENGKTVILALYESGKFIELQKETYKGEPIMFTTNKTYTEAKVMVWDDLTKLKPVCDVEELN